MFESDCLSVGTDSIWFVTVSEFLSGITFLSVEILCLSDSVKTCSQTG